MNPGFKKALLHATGIGLLCLSASQAYSRPALIRSTFTVTEDDASISEVNLSSPANGWSNASNPGSNSYDYVAIDFYADTTGNYTFGQTAGPVDTAMAVYYNNKFDIDNLQDPDAYNDDSGLSGESCGCCGCPAVEASLERDINNTLVITTYSPSRSLSLPLSFYSLGVGNILFTVNPSSGSEFFVPVSEASKTDAMASIMDGIASGSTSASTALTNSLTGLAIGSEQSRANALRNIAPNTSVAVSTVTTQVMQTGFSRIDGRMASVQSSTKNAVGGSTSTHGSDYVTAYADETSGDPSRFDAFKLFDKKAEDENAQTILKNNIWGEFSGFKSEQDTDGGFAGFDSTSQSFMFGFDTALTEQIFAGIAFSYTATDVDMKDFRNGDTVDSDSYQATLYGSYEFAEDWLLGGKLSYARHEMDTSRNTVTSVASGSYGVDQFGVQADLSHAFAFSNGLIVKPKVGLSYINLQQEAYSETGSALALSYDSISSDQLYSSVSVEVSKSFDVSKKTVLTPNAAVGWNHNYLADGTDMVARFVGGGGDFTSAGQALEEDSLSLNAGLSINYDKNFNFDINATGAFADNYSEYGAKARLTYSF